ncbi:MAG: hypothetical protein H7Y61_20380, partial [Rhizobiales bacterium]|nr:hypothetical protein [Rhizobacter sp.]
MSMHEGHPTPESRGALLRRWRHLGVLSFAALLLHAAILGGATWVWPSNAPEPLRSAMQVRVLEPMPAPAPSSVVEPTHTVPVAPRPPRAITALA